MSEVIVNTLCDWCGKEVDPCHDVSTTHSTVHLPVGVTSTPVHQVPPGTNPKNVASPLPKFASVLSHAQMHDGVARPLASTTPSLEATLHRACLGLR